MLFELGQFLIFHKEINIINRHKEVKCFFSFSEVLELSPILPPTETIQPETEIPANGNGNGIGMTR